jgi:hypothetical protein
MKPMTFKLSKFRLKKFLAALHQFSPEGNPLPGVSGDSVHHEGFDLCEDLSSDLGEEFGEIPADSFERLKAGLSLFGFFALFDGDTSFNCIDGQEVKVPDLDGEDEYEEEETAMPRRRRTRRFLEMAANTPCDECTSFGFLISLSGNKVEIEPKAMRDVDGDCELEMMLEPNLLSDSMRKWVRSFLFPKRGGKA